MIDLNAYYKMIGLNSDDQPLDLEFLTSLISKHLLRFGYQNTYLYQQGKKPRDERVPGAISLESVFDLFIVRKQTGYCFQNIELLFGVLNQIGFKVERHLARVYNQSLVDIDFEKADKKPFDHEVLMVELAGKLYTVDTGFANNSLRGPLPMQIGEQNIGSDNYRLSHHHEDWLLELQVKPNQWLCLYKIASAPCSQEQVLAANTQLFTDPNPIAIRDGFNKIACVTPEKRKFIIKANDGTMLFKSFKHGQLYRERPIDSEQQFNALVENKFTIK